ncbi:MAG TPA: helix-hairpin-helix domain-containing protein [Aridibacter sp.]|nr:helix-hairpin-helix domain-containing protein [Aridibacter sp.]
MLACLLQAALACVQSQAPGEPQSLSDSPDAIDINSASEKELETLPGIGGSTARKIIAHRERFGEFRRKEHLLLVEGISEKKYLALSDLITALPFGVEKQPGPESHTSRGSNGSQKKGP